MTGFHCQGCGSYVFPPHTCPNLRQYYPSTQSKVTIAPDPLERIAIALERLVAIFEQAEDTQNRRLPRDASPSV